MTPAERKAFAETIRPAVKGKSDKFSWRLYQRARKYGRERVYLATWDSIFGPRPASLDELKAGNVPPRRIMFGELHGDGCFGGKQLADICCQGAPLQNYAYGHGHGVKNWIEITDWFWTQYLRHGRCQFFPGQHDWITINANARKCRHCGQHQRRTVVTKKAIERREVWA